MANDKETPAKETPAKGKVKVKLLKDCYGTYRIADPIGVSRTVSAELAEKMIASKHAAKA